MRLNSLLLLCGFLLLPLALAACGNSDPAPAGNDSGTTAVSDTAAAPTQPAADLEAAAAVAGVALVDSIELIILESFPVQISLKARGTLPNGCTSIDDVSINRNGNEFDINITTVAAADAICTQVLVPFEETIPLGVEGLPAGSYQVNVNDRIGSFTLSVDNVAGAQPTAVPNPTATPTPEPEAELALVNGRVWHDLCAVGLADDGSATPQEGCIANGADGFQGNGLLENGEPGLPSISLDMGLGQCPSTGFASAVSDEDGDYIFIDVPAGDYCISIDAQSSENSLLLETGLWTFPEPNLAEINLEIADGEVVTGINFGWDYEFLPVPEIDLANCDNSLEFVEDINIPDDTLFGPGQSFEKRWLLRNNGSCPWTEGYSLAFLDGPLIPDATLIPLNAVVVAGQTIEVAATFTAPDAAGTYRSNWQIQDSSGNLFGVNGLLEEAFWVQIVVGTPAATPAPNSGVIGGVVWADSCFFTTEGEPSVGCVEIEDSGFYRADGTLNFSEGRLADVTVTLAQGACPEDGRINAAAVVATAVTDSTGLYQFTSLDEDTYCLFIDALSDDNINLLLPGDWTWPFPGVGLQGVLLDAGETLLEVDFGWDFRE